jgi:hypothetical protein
MTKLTKRHKRNLLREFTTQELQLELQKRLPGKSWQRGMLDALLDGLSKKEIRMVVQRLTEKTHWHREPAPKRITS